MRAHLDTDFLIFALTVAGPERRLLLELADSGTEIQMSAVAWYEFCRGPRTPQHLAVARAFLREHGIIPFSEELAAISAEVFRGLGSPRRRAADIAIGVTASGFEADLYTRNESDFAGVPNLNIRTSQGEPEL